jgi:hypothetical protein
MLAGAVHHVAVSVKELNSFSAPSLRASEGWGRKALLN